MKAETASIKNTNWRKYGNNLRMPRVIVEASLFKRIQGMEGGISVIEDKIKEMDTLVKKIVKSKILRFSVRIMSSYKQSKQ